MGDGVLTRACSEALTPACAGASAERVLELSGEELGEIALLDVGSVAAEVLAVGALACEVRRALAAVELPAGELPAAVAARAVCAEPAKISALGADEEVLWEGESWAASEDAAAGDPAVAAVVAVVAVAEDATAAFVVAVSPFGVGAGRAPAAVRVWA